MMISIYEKSTTSFLNNGLGVLRDFYSNPQITEELNGSFYLEFEYAKDGWLSEYLVEENIIKANGQPFRICNTNKTLKYIKVLAKHICFDLNKNFLEDVYPQELSGNSAINWLLDHTQYEHNFTGYSDIATTGTVRYVRKNLFEAFISADNSLINVWGGEFSYDNFEVSLLAHRGEDRGLTVRYGKNLNGVECNVDFSTVATRIMPIGANGLLLTEKYIDSSLIANYQTPIVKTVEFSDIGVTEDIDEATAMQMLRDEVAKLYTAGIDLPTTSVKVDFIELSKVKEYENYSNLETVYLGDTIHFVIEPLNLDLTTRVVSITYDCLLERNVKLELGTITPNFINQQTKTLSELKSKVDSVSPTTILAQAQANATLLLRQPFSGYTYFDDGGNFYIMDTTSIATAQSIWKFGLGGIGYSATGINGTFTIAITQDGQIVADFITTGVLKTSIIEGYDTLVSTVNGNTISIDNNYQEVIDKFNGYTPINQTVELEESVTTLQTNTYVKTEIDTKLTDGTVTMLKSTILTADDDGLTVDKSDSNVKSNLDSDGLSVIDKTSNSNEVLLFAGYDTALQQTVVRSKNMRVENYLDVGDYLRFQNYKNGWGAFYRKGGGV